MTVKHIKSYLNFTQIWEQFPNTKSMLVLGQSGGRSNGKTEDLFSRTDHHEIARGGSAARAREER